jgi:hypothetical protein
LKEYIVVIIIPAIALIGMLCIIVDMIIGGEEYEENIIIKKPKISNSHSNEDSVISELFDSEDDLIINE